MATDKAERDEKREKRDKKDKKEHKKSSRSEKDGVHKSKKDKKDIGQEGNEHVADALLNALEENISGSATIAVKVNGDVAVSTPPPIGALVPFANPLADEKAQKKTFRTVKKAAKNKSLKRGVKEVVKALRKTPSTAQDAGPPSVVILAADISPMDVISHIPVLCEDHNIPYLFVKSRAELGAAGNTKRPTSVVMVTPERGGKKKANAQAEGAEGEEDFRDVYNDLVKLVRKESRNVRI